jgi:heme/copper-type cytochrome/quinol oxidase subunit 2
MSMKINSKSVFLLGGMIAALVIVSCATSEKQMTSAEIMNLQPSGQIVDGVRVVKVTAQRYKFTPNPIVVKSGEKVRVELTSLDTTHGFKLSEYDINVKIEPGKTSTATFTAGNPGEYSIACSVYCGVGHFGMKATLVVLPSGS